ncbi:hypothetical protein LY44_01316 [Rhodobacter capsulatus]|nr:hypothetical protein LY44_01316 [Rhodobacter capsulatus]
MAQDHPHSTNISAATRVSKSFCAQNLGAALMWHSRARRRSFHRDRRVQSPLTGWHRLHPHHHHALFLGLRFSLRSRSYAHNSHPTRSTHLVTVVLSATKARRKHHDNPFQDQRSRQAHHRPGERPRPSQDPERDRRRGRVSERELHLDPEVRQKQVTTRPGALAGQGARGRSGVSDADLARAGGGGDGGEGDHRDLRLARNCEREGVA